MIPEYGIVRLSAPTNLSIVGCRIARGALDGIISSISHTFHMGKRDSIFSLTAMRLLKWSQSTPYIPQILGDFLKLGDTPRPPAGSILHLFFSGLFI